MYHPHLGATDQAECLQDRLTHVYILKFLVHQHWGFTNEHLHQHTNSTHPHQHQELAVCLLKFSYLDGS